MLAPNHIVYVFVALVLQGCWGGPVAMRKDALPASLQTLSGSNSKNVVTREVESGVVEADLSANESLVQNIAVNHIQGLEGMSIQIQPGTLGLDTTLTIEEGVSLATPTVAQNLGIGGQFQSASKAVTVNSNQNQALNQPFVIALPVPDETRLALADPYERLIVLYKITMPGTNEVISGAYARDTFTVAEKLARFESKYMGSFQLVWVSIPMPKSVQAPASTPVLTKRQEAKEPLANVDMILDHQATDGFINAQESTSADKLFKLEKAFYNQIFFSELKSAGDCDASLKYPESNVPLIHELPAADGVYYLCAKLIDNADRVSYFRSASVIKDTMPPTVNAGSDQSGIVPIALNGSSSGAQQWVWSQSSGPGTAIFSSINAESTSVTSASPGAYIFKLTAIDTAGNSTSDEVSVTILPPTFPVINTINLAGEAIDGYISFSEKDATSDLLSVTATNYSIMEFSNFLAPSAECNSSVVYGFSSIPRVNDLISDGSFIICVHITDGSNEAFGKSAPIIRDTVSPSYSALALVNEASDGYVNLAEKNSSLSLLNLVASDTAAFTAVLADSALSCNASQTYNHALSPAIHDIPNTDGAFAVCVRLSDLAGNTTYAKSPQVVRDTTPPGVNAGADVTVNTVTNLAASASGAANFLWTKESGPGSVTFGSPNAVSTTFSAAGDGTYQLRITAADLAGNTATDDVIVNWDVTPPTFTSLDRIGDAADGYVNDAEKNNTSPLWSLTASGYTTASYTMPLDSSVACDSGKTYSSSSIARAVDLPNNQATDVICVKLVDNAGNVVYGKSQTVMRDTIAPVVDVGSDRTTNAAFTLNATVTGASTYAWSKLSGAGTITFGSAAASSTTITASADGVYVIQLSASDFAGNSATDTFTLTWSTVGPTITSFIAANEAADGYVNSAEAASTQDAVALSQSGATSIFYSALLPNSGLTCNASVTYAGGIPTINSLPATDGAYAVCAKLVDSASNIAYAKSTVIVRDTSAPTVNTGIPIVTNGTASIDASSSGGATYVWTMQSGPGIISFGSVNSEDTTASADTDGSYVLRLTVTDAAGNSNFSDLNFTRDTQAPVFTALTPANGASDGYVNMSEVGSPNIFATLTASGYSAVSYSAILSSASVCNGSITYIGALPTIQSMPGTDGSYALCVRLSDTAGNVTYGKSGVVVRDTIPPTVNAGADFITASIYSINATTTGAVTWAWSKQSGSGTVSFGSASAEDTSVSASADGIFVLRLTVVDNAGNVAFDEVTMNRDATPPTISSVTLNGVASDGYVNLAEVANGGALVTVIASGLSSLLYTAPFDDITPVTCDNSLTYNATVPAVSNIPATDGVYAVCVKALDDAGNKAFAKSPVVTRDTVAPNVSSFILQSPASDGYINSAERSSSSPLAALNASGYVTASYSQILDNTPAVTCNGSQTYSNSSVPLINQLLSIEDQFVVCAKLVDAAGNVTYYASQAVTVDLTPPTVALGSDIITNNVYAINATTADAQYYSWSKISGPMTITFGSPSAEDTTVSASTDGTAVLRLTVSDIAGNSSFDEVNFTRDTVPPAVNVGADVIKDEVVTTSASVNEAIQTYNWSVTSGNDSDVIFSSPNLLNTSIMPTASGVYNVRLTAIDLAGNMGFDEFVVTWGTPHSTVFVTDTTYPGNFSLASRDMVCQEQAEAQGLSGEYVTVASTATINASSRFNIMYSVRLVDQTVIATSPGQLWGGTLTNPINRSVTGLLFSGTFWSGSTSTGTYASGFNCTDWTSTSGNGKTGMASTTASTWLSSSSTTCNVSQPIMCMSVNKRDRFTARPGKVGGTIKLTYSLPSPLGNISRVEVRRNATNCADGSLISPSWNTGLTAGTLLQYTDLMGVGAAGTNVNYRACVYSASSQLLAQYISSATVPSQQVIFLTAAQTSGSLGGLSGADSRCASEASAAGLIAPSGWKALLSTSTIDAGSRITRWPGALVNTVGQNLLTSANNMFTGGSLLSGAYIIYDATGTQIGSTYTTFTNTTATGTRMSSSTSQTCNDFTNTSGSVQFGTANSSAGWLSSMSNTCSTQGRLYCVSQ